MKLFEWQSGDFKVPQKTMSAFATYLNEVWQNRTKYLEKEEFDEDRFARTSQRQQFFTFTGDGKIIARNYVGVVQYEDIRIQVYPKLFARDAEKNYTRYQLNFLFWLSYCRKIRFPFSLVDLSVVDFDDLLELIVYIFANYTHDTLSQQPFQGYEEVTEETNYLRGRLHFDNYVNENIITAKWQHFYCTYAPFIYDNRFNRIVKFVTKQLLQISTHTLNRERLSSVLFLLHDVTDVPVTAADCDKVKLNPLFADLRNVLNLCRLILENQFADTQADDNQNFCFLIPMEYVFEDFIFGFITEHFPSLGFQSQSQTHLALNQKEKVFQIRNDLYLEQKLIIDTKYKSRTPDEGIKGGVNQTDLYQMIAYSIRRNCPNSILLYPLISNCDNRSISFTIPTGELSKELNINIRSVDITFSSYADAVEVIKNRFKDIDGIFARA